MLTLHDTSGFASIHQFDWDRIVPLLERLCADFPQDNTPAGIVRDLIKGKANMWLVRDEDDATVLVVITSISTVEATKCKRLTIHGYVGDRGMEALPLLALIEEKAMVEGCHEVEVFGRRGWTRALKDLGYEDTAVVVRKRLGGHDG